VEGAALIGYLQLLDAQTDGIAELKSMAVIATHQRTGVGRALVEEAVRRSRFARRQPDRRGDGGR
jgi:ribosomal protein S18 acetylase RimI-like enzyme